MARTYDRVSRDAQLALTEFSSAFDEAFVNADIDPWATTLGMTNTSSAIATTYPIPVSAAGYRRRKGDDRMRTLFERSLTMYIEEWSDGVQALAAKVEAPDFIGWGVEPANMAEEAKRQPNALVAAMLAANPYLDLYRDEKQGGSVASTIHMFDTHPVNIFDATKGSFTNRSSHAAINAAFVKAVKTKFRKRKGPNGKPGGYKFNGLIVPAALEEEALDFFASDALRIDVQNLAGTENVGAIATNNRHKGTIKVIVADELEQDNVVYPIDLKKGKFSWIVQDGGAPEEIVYDKSDALYKDKGMIAIKRVLKMSCAMALPHGIEECTIG